MLTSGHAPTDTSRGELSVVEQMEWDGEWVPRATLEKMGIIPADEIAEVEALKLPEEEKRA